MSDVTRRMAKRPPMSEGECDICGEPAIEGHTHILKAADCGTEHDIKLTYGGPVSEAQVKATPNLSELQDIARCLNSLLYDPHPGLFTWRQALDAQLRAIQPFTPSHDKLLEALKAAHKLLSAEHFDTSDGLVSRCEEIAKLAEAAIQSAEEQPK